MAVDIHHSSAGPSTGSSLYNGIPPSQIQPVFQAALRLRHRNPQAEEIIAITETTLEASVVSALVEGALRLIPPGKDPATETIRKQKQQARGEQALHAEKNFVNKVRAVQSQIMDERQQSQSIRNAINDGRNITIKLTPDILFLTPTTVNGVSCHWIEYKDTFGFKADPFVHPKNRKQLRKYATTFGSGMVVYKLGYQTELLSIEGVACFREAEVIDWINHQVS